MLKNYFKTVFRVFWKNKFFSFVNIAGLAVGISIALVIYLLVAFDFSFDTFQKNGDRIYRVVSHFTYPGDTNKSTGVPYPMAKALHNEITGLDAVAAIRTWQGGYSGIKVNVPGVQKQQPSVYRKQEHIVFADAKYFKLLGYNWLAGNVETSLSNPYQIVLTQSNAALYFPDMAVNEIIGRELYFNDTIRTTVTGIIQDIDKNTDFTFKTFISNATLETAQLKPDGWDSWASVDPSSQLFIRLAPNASSANIQNQIATVASKYGGLKIGDNITAAYSLQPLSDIHFNADYDNYNPHIANKPTLYSLLAIAAFILLLACINFINLTTAQGTQRAKEIGIRKTMGSTKQQLVVQFLSETFLFTFFAAALSLALVPILLHALVAFIPQGLHFNLLKQPRILLFLLLLVVVVSLLSGVYPAVVLSNYKPVLILKNNAFTSNGKTRGKLLRKTLIVAQFTIAQVFIIATIIVSKQINYSLTADMGFKKDAILYFDANYNDTVKSHKFILRDKLKAIPGVAMVSLSNTPATNSGGLRGGTMKYNDGKKEIATQVKIKFGDTSYIPLYQMQLLAGSNLPNKNNITSVVINETYARILGFNNPQQAIGRYINWNDWGITTVPIAGVVKDFHLRSFHEAISPLVISSRVNEQLTFNVALQPQTADGNGWRKTIASIQTAWKEVYPNDELEYHFIDDAVAKYYEAEQHISGLLLWTTALSMFISCLGLLGLVIYITNQRTKEIGVRKVIGATITQLITLLATDFLKPVFIAFVIAVPVAWWGAHTWLQNFAYKTALSWWVFVAGGIVMLLAAFAILSVKTFKAAVANPVKALRSE